jgi:uracil-DNA glycosylase family 4
MSDAVGADWPPLRSLKVANTPSYWRMRRLAEVYERIAEDPFWDYLRQPGIRLVKGDGPADAKIMIIGEAPGARENGEGRPFVGQSGKILDQLIELMGSKRERCFVTNVVKYRPPGNATPNLAAVLHGQESLREEWRVVRPRLTIAVGSTAHQAIHPRRGLMSIGQCRVQPGWPFEFPRKDESKPRNYCISIYHPAYGLRAGKRIMDLIERDWEALGDWARENEPDVVE